MKVVLKRNVPGLGNANDVKNVSDGYARNYLIPHGLAVQASDGQLRAAKELAETKEAKEERLREHSLSILERLKDTPLNFKVKAGETGRLYGSITNADVGKAIGRVVTGKFDKRWVLMKRPIREIGTHMVDLKLPGDVRGQARVIVSAED